MNIPTAPSVPMVPNTTPAPNIEAAEEAKLRAKYPNINRPMAGHSAFLQKRLAKGVNNTYFLRVAINTLGRSYIEANEAMTRLIFSVRG